MRRLVPLPLAVVVALLVAGCGGGGAGPDTDDPGGKVFAANGCSGCHVLAAAGAKGTRGPSLDRSGGLNAEDVEARVTQGGQGMPRFGSRLSETQIADVAAYVVKVRKG